MSQFALKTGLSIIWHFIEVFLSKGIHIITTLLLAWFLVPEDYALVAMLTLFIAFSNVIVDAGFSQALLRQKTVTLVHLNTAFSVSLAIAVVVYVCFFITAPWVATFYNAPALTDLLRVVSVTLFLQAFSLIPKNLLQRALAFKVQLKVMFPATLLSAACSILFASMGFGVWALILQIVLQAGFVSIFLYIKQPWSICWQFDRQAFNELWLFSRFIMFDALLSIPFKNIYLIVLPKFFASYLIGLYFMAAKVHEMLTYLLTEAIQNVTYPALAKRQDQPEQLLSGYRQVMNTTTFIMFPVMLFLSALAPLVFAVLLPQKWFDAAQYLQIMAIAGIFYPLAAINLNILKVVGAGRLLFYIGLFKYGLLVVILIFSLQFGEIEIVIWGHIFAAFIGYIPNAWYANKLIGYSIPAQLKDIGGNLLLSGAIAGGLYMIVSYVSLGGWWELFLLGVSASLVYLGIAWLAKFPALLGLIGLFKQLREQRRH